MAAPKHNRTLETRIFETHSQYVKPMSSMSEVKESIPQSLPSASD